MSVTSYNVFNVIYLIFRLAPIIFVSYFLLQSMFNLDPRGAIYLVGLLIGTIVTISASYMLEKGLGDDLMSPPNHRCNTFYLGAIPIGTGGSIQPLSKAPLNILVYAYTLAYLVTSFTAPPVTYANALIALQQNVAILVIFPLLLIFEALWLMNNSCNSVVFMMISLIIGIGWGIGWAYSIRSTKRADLQYLNIGNVEVCSRPSKTIYRCKNINTT
jgi:hypothetical protein|uniref:Uncharacterized protein n=1 Tax=viral metagenome TaxID=1070528 RepID=A0A6C0IBK0_9ZZZZ